MNPHGSVGWRSRWFPFIFGLLMGTLSIAGVVLLATDSGSPVVGAGLLIAGFVLMVSGAALEQRWRRRR